MQQDFPARSPHSSISEGLAAARADAVLGTAANFHREDAGRSLAEMAQRDLDAALQLLADRAQFITGASGAAIALRRDGMKDMLCRASTGSNAPGLGALLSSEFGLSGESVRSKQLLRCDDAERDARVNREVCRQLGIASVLVMPVVHDDEVLGVFELFSGSANAFGPRDLSAMQRLGEMVETAVRLAQVTENLPEELKADEGALAAGTSAGVEEQILDEEILDGASRGATVASQDDPDVLHAAPEMAETLKQPPQESAAPKNAENKGTLSPTTTEPQAKGAEPCPAQPASSEKANAGVAASPKPLFWSAAEAGSVEEKPAEADRSHVPPVLRGLRKCELCGFPISDGRALCVECEEKKWRGQLKRPQPMLAVGVAASGTPKRESQSSAAVVKSVKEKPLSLGTLAKNGAAVAGVSPAEAKEPAKTGAPTLSPSTATEVQTAEAATVLPVANSEAPAVVLSGGLEESRSWISANKYILAMLALVAVVIVVFSLFR